MSTGHCHTFYHWVLQLFMLSFKFPLESLFKTTNHLVEPLINCRDSLGNYNLAKTKFLDTPPPPQTQNFVKLQKRNIFSTYGGLEAKLFKEKLPIKKLDVHCRNAQMTDRGRSQ